MKKFKIIFSIIVLFGIFSIVWANGDTSTSSNNWYNSVIYDNDFDFVAVNKGDEVVLSWNKFTKEDLTYYKVIKSTTNSDPVYPEDGYIKYSTDINFTEYVDNSTITKTTYYRVCAITTKMNRYCSNGEKVSPLETNVNLENKTKNTETSEIKNYDVSSSLKIKADNIINSFISKMKELSYSNEKIVLKINSTITKLEELKSKKTNLKNLISYFITQLESKKSSFENNLNDIEAIFDL